MMTTTTDPAAMDLLLWALLHCEGSSTCGPRAELEFADGTEVIVPMAGHLPDTAHPHWPAARDAMIAARTRHACRSQRQARAVRLLTARMHCAVAAAADPRRPVPPYFPDEFVQPRARR